MLRSGGIKLSLGTSNVSGGGGRPHAGTEGDRRSGSSLAKLESVLQRLNKHDERTHIHRVERTSLETQQKLLKDELLKAQEELALAHTGKNKLCEEIGALQQAKQDQQAQIDHLLVELRSSRESQAAMAKKVTELEHGSQDLKRKYIQSLTYRVKAASELLSRLQVGAAVADSTVELNKEIQSKCEVWVGSEPNKRKRVEDPPQPTVEEDCAVEDDPMECRPTKLSRPQTACNSENLRGADNTTTDPMEPTVCSDSVMQKSVNTEGCQSCIQLALQNSDLKNSAEKELQNIKNSFHELQVQHSDLTKAHERAQARMAALSNLLEEKDGTIDGLNEALEIEKEKVTQAEKAIIETAAKLTDEDGDSAPRIKVFELLGQDNLAQLNTYADHLEMLISQCASCSVKLQSENTQASEQ